MTNETFEPVGLLDITKQLTANRNKLDYVKQLDEVYDDIDCHPDYDAKTDSILLQEQRND